VWSFQRAALEVSTPTWMRSGGCVPATCASLGQECGQPRDGCGGTLDCGGCVDSELCVSGLCVETLVTNPAPPGCVLDTCEGSGIECGLLSDGCGGYLGCGSCQSGSSCNSGTCVPDPPTSPPPPACEPETCESLSRVCGVASDGCGGALSCGTCGSAETCTSSGSCVAEPTPPPACVPDTCQSLGIECGGAPDGCGSSMSCGTCSGEDVCTNNVCGPASEESEKPVEATTGANCAAPGCPSATLGSLSAAGANCRSTITVNGTTCENFTTNGSITINADNVTLRNFIVNANGGRYGVYPTAGSSGITVEYGEIYNAESAGLYNLSNNFYAQRLYVHDIGGDAFKIEGNGATVEWSFLEKLGTAPDAHADGNQTRDGSNITFRYNNMWMPAPGTPNYPGRPYKANATAMHCCNISNVVYEYNWLNGGGYTVYCQTSGQNVRGISVRNNLFGRDYAYGPRSGTCDEWSGNRWEDTGEPL
jgi:hypothetical protein